MSERRYSDEEVAAIFRQAAEDQQTVRPRPATDRGLTLAEVREIGRDVGIPSELIDRAAHSLDRVGDVGGRSFLGFPIAVRRTVDLERPLLDEEWEHLVGDLREIFEARGRVRYDGPFREWTNGNLHVLVEPTAAGHRIRMQTLKGNARTFMTAGLGFLGVAAAMLIPLIVTGQLGEAGSVSGLVVMAASGVGLFAAGALGLPAWARRRLDQMEDIAGRLATAAGTGDKVAPRGSEEDREDRRREDSPPR